MSFLENFSSLVAHQRTAECITAYLMESMSIIPRHNGVAASLGDASLTNKQAIHQWVSNQHHAFVSDFDTDQFAPLVEELIAITSYRAFDDDAIL